MRERVYGKDWKKEIERYHEMARAYRDSKGSQKMWNYFMEVTKTEYFNDVIRNIRAKYNIPENGFETNEDGSYSLPPRGFKNESNLRQEIIDKICKKYQLHYFDFSDVLLSYIFYNKLDPLYDLGSCGLFTLSDVVEEKEEPFDELFQASDDMAYPIAIRISPYASQRDLIDFTKVVWKEIEAYQKQYRSKDIKIGKIKARNKATQERNDLIYKNRHESLKKIGELLADKDIFLDDGHIAKIRSLEKQRRKEL
ncbi:hypothetical protein C4544_05720 [candidate division WS5 bacterium]|uniref:Uncharacterized protein n=1 Tax=candidate division WS5 bacterium TaxID=2093353 RepID=A0A419DAT0_9BACT|nr:MAG: hypothetical protein C4544_05720 [candidate division WS5 bacterium]